MEKKLINSGSPWEEKVGYSRAVIIGNQMEISGTTAVKDEKVIAPYDAYGQSKFILEQIQGIIEKHGFKMSDVIRTRVYVTDISHWEEVAKAHGEYFHEIKPCSTMVEVSKLIHQEVVVEIEFSLLKAS